MNIPQWVDGCFCPSDRLYLIEVVANGQNRFELQLNPGRTNQSREPKLYGFLGETNNVSRIARGVVMVVDLNKQGERVRIHPLKGVDLKSFLEEDGYPELAEGVD